MKRLLFLITLLPFSLCMNFARAQWSDISIPSSYTLDKGSFPDNDHGYVIPSGYDRIFRTVNGGVTWDSIWFPGAIVHDVDFISADTGFALVDGPFGQFALKRTFDGGNTWSENMAPFAPSYLRMRFINSTTGFLLNSDGNMVSTTDAGVNWSSPIPTGNNLQPYDKEYTGKDTIIMSGWDGSFMYRGAITRSDDGGNSWQTHIHDTAYSSFTGTHFTSGNKGYAVYTTGWPVYRNVLDKTTDGGISWSNIVSDTASTIGYTDIFMTSSSEGYIAVQTGSTGAILKLNGSSTTVDHSINYPLRRFYKGGTTLFVLGDGGKILKLALPGTGVQPITIPLIGIYPNPTSDLVNIPVESQSEILVLDINGRILMSTIISPGEPISFMHLPNGTYCVKVKNGKGNFGGRIVVNH